VADRILIVVLGVAFAYGPATLLLYALGDADRDTMLHWMAGFGAVMFALGTWLNSWLTTRVLRSYWKAQGYHADAAQEAVDEIEAHGRRGTWLKYGGRNR
jgi:protein-S-isoprenylcysteine O-methyltransferase Ste14